MTKWGTIAVVGVLLVSAPVAAQNCADQATVGNFELTYDGAVFDGAATELTYCVTGLAGHALSNWELALSELCIDPDDLVGCGPDPCFYQADDPNTGITGIKWDDLEVENGQTECFTVALAGDWTSSIGSTTVGLKAATDVFYGSVCGPVCDGCAFAADVLAGNPPILDVTVVHNRPPTVTADIAYQVFDISGNMVLEWVDGPITLSYGSEYRVLEARDELGTLPPGAYQLVVKFEGMSGWHTRRARFRIQ